MKTPAWLTLLAVCVALTLYVEWHTDEVTVALAVMLLCAVSLGLLNPPLAPVGGAVLGFSILAAHALTEAAGVLRPRYMPRPLRRATGPPWQSPGSSSPPWPSARD